MGFSRRLITFLGLGEVLTSFVAPSSAKSSPQPTGCHHPHVQSRKIHRRRGPLPQLAFQCHIWQWLKIWVPNDPQEWSYLVGNHQWFWAISIWWFGGLQIAQLRMPTLDSVEDELWGSKMFDQSHPLQLSLTPFFQPFLAFFQHLRECPQPMLAILLPEPQGCSSLNSSKSLGHGNVSANDLPIYELWDSIVMKSQKGDQSGLTNGSKKETKFRMITNYFRICRALEIHHPAPHRFASSSGSIFVEPARCRWWSKLQCHGEIVWSWLFWGSEILDPSSDSKEINIKGQLGCTWILEMQFISYIYAYIYIYVCMYI